MPGAVQTIHTSPGLPSTQSCFPTASFRHTSPAVRTCLPEPACMPRAGRGRWTRRATSTATAA